MRVKKVSLSCFCFFAAAVMCVFGAKAQNKSVDFIAQMSFGQVQYLSPSNLTVSAPHESDIRSFGMEVQFGARLFDRLTTKIGFSSLGGTVNYHNEITREEAGIYYANFELGYDFKVKDWRVSPSIGIGYLGYNTNFKIQSQKHLFTGSGLGSNVSLSVAYYFYDNFAVRASAGAVCGYVSSLNPNQDTVPRTSVLEIFDALGDFSIFTSKFSLGIELSL